MADEIEIDPGTLARARQALADWMNEHEDDDEPRLEAESFEGWQVWPVEEFLVFSSPGGFTNMLYLVGEGVVRAFSYSSETEEYAAAAARAERDGTEPPAPPAPAISWENWNDQ
ncbi:hypothetical protein Kfla_3246 [Kribbella flavida DSM 17836]|uniref:Uncharacterized protein n=1 Tax=Kribbella flavida (strain DSM 17836 / JCM 10339 / NBRC 14399) TaxID=479435 RepID=D2Q4J4_KRIFD|nr:hypothetical protein [Kribbella flavida]ADB32308.1 hypothetical protein Kfla_3246 [Kribbella flavida DSM 17836]